MARHVKFLTRCLLDEKSHHTHSPGRAVVRQVPPAFVLHDLPVVPSEVRTLEEKRVQEAAPSAVGTSAEEAAAEEAQAELGSENAVVAPLASSWVQGPGGRWVTRREESEDLDLRRQEERDYIRQHDQAGGVDVWYIVACPWLAAWKRFCLQGEDLPGGIDNGILFGPEGELKAGLKSGVDYRGLSRRIWEFLHGRYGGGPEVRRRVLDVYAAEPAEEEEEAPEDARAAGV